MCFLPAPLAGSGLLGYTHIPNLGASYRAFPRHLPTMGFDSMHINLSSYCHLALAGDVGNLHANNKTVGKHEIT